MALINHYDDIIPQRQRSGNFFKLEDSCKDDLAHIAFENVFKIFTRGCRKQTGDISSIECCGNLRIQINAVRYNQHGGVIQLRQMRHFLCCKHHQQRLTATLKMPDQTLLDLVLQHTLNNQICTFVLLISADNLNFAVSLIRGVQGKEAEDIHNLCRCDHVRNADPHIFQGAFILMVGCMPGAPHGAGHIDRAITIALTLRGKVKDAGNKHLRNHPLIVCNVIGSVQPSDGTAHRCFQFANGNRNAVDQQNDVEATATIYAREDPLIGYHTFILIQGAICLSSKDVYGYMLTILTKGERVLFENQLLKDLILCNQIVRTGRQNNIA